MAKGRPSNSGCEPRSARSGESTSRRGFLKSAGTAVAGAAVVGCLPRLAVASDNLPGTGPQRAKIVDEAFWRLCTERARRALSWAEEEAGLAGMPEVETEHLLLALLREDNLGAGALVRCGVSLDTLRSVVREEMTRGAAGSHRVTQLGPGARRALDLAHEEARQLNNNYIGCEHLLLGLLQEDKGLAARVLARLGVTQECCRREIPIVGERWVEVGEAEARLRDHDTPENQRRLQEALAAYHAFIRQTPRLEVRSE
jgi:ATP-dependent Clp protease ATP-binding subunit ClpA